MPRPIARHFRNAKASIPYTRSNIAFRQSPIQSGAAFPGTPACRTKTKSTLSSRNSRPSPACCPAPRKSKLAAAAHQHWPPSPKVWVAFAVVVVLSAVGGYSYRHSGKSSAKANAPSSDTVKVAAVEAAAPPKTTENLPLAPGPVATTQELAKPWSTKRFLFRDPVTTQPEPAIVVRLPHGAYWGFSLREPFGNCELEYITDLQKLRTDTAFAPTTPWSAIPAITPSTICSDTAAAPQMTSWCVV